MKHLCTAAVLVALMAGAVSAQTAQDMWPNQVGNTWTYEITGRIPSSENPTIEITSVSGGWVEVKGLAGNDPSWWWMSGSSGKVWYWNADVGNYELVFDFAVPKGKTFVTQFPDGCTKGATATVIENASTVEVPAGKFANCVQIGFGATRCADAGIGGYTFAKNVGPLGWGWMTIAGPQEAKLIHAVVNGVEYKPAPAVTGGLSVGLTIDAATYYHVTVNPPLMRPSTLGTVQATFTIANGTADNIPLTFNSGQRYDFVVRNSSGRIVCRWSDGRMFTQNVTTTQLEAGKKFEYKETIVLKDTAGTPLTPGKYTIEAVQTTTPEALRMKATAAFDLKRKTLP